MTDAKPSRVAAFLAANQEKALALIEPSVGPGDEVVAVGPVVLAEVRQFPLFCNLRVTLRDGRVLLFKEMLREHADGLKDAVDAAGERGSEVG